MSGSKLSNPSAPAAPADSPLLDQPLGLTVHSMPVPGEVVPADAKRTRLGRWQMLLVLALCAAPVIASYTMYYLVRPSGRTNFGELIDPQRPLPDVAALTLDGQATNLRQLKGQWLLVSVAGGACDTTCERHLYLQRQLRETMGKDKDRVDWVWLVADDAPVPAKLLPALKEATVLRVPQAQLAQWLAPSGGHALAQHLYLVDPLGNWMLRFPAALDLPDAAKAKRDLERVLRASASWDKAGR